MIYRMMAMSAPWYLSRGHCRQDRRVNLIGKSSQAQMTQHEYGAEEHGDGIGRVLSLNVLGHMSSPLRQSEWRREKGDEMQTCGS